MLTWLQRVYTRICIAIAVVRAKQVIAFLGDKNWQSAADTKSACSCSGEFMLSLPKAGNDLMMQYPDVMRAGVMRAMLEMYGDDEIGPTGDAPEATGKAAPHKMQADGSGFVAVAPPATD